MNLLNRNAPIIGLAPMAGISDLFFRDICEDFGADYSITEMASTLPHLIKTKKNQSRLSFTKQKKPNIIQLIGNDAKEMAYATSYYNNNLPIDGIDINFGCPAKNVRSQGAGSALLSDLNKVEEIIASVTKKSLVPVSIKTRIGSDKENITVFNIAEIACNYGVKQLTIHGRTRALRFNGSANYDLIAEVKNRFSDLFIIANGDIDSVEKAMFVLNYTKCDGLMIGRAAVGNPWLFSHIKGSFPTREKCIKRAISHIKAIHCNIRSDIATKTTRKHIKAYINYFCKKDQCGNFIDKEKIIKTLTSNCLDTQFLIFSELLLKSS